MMRSSYPRRLISKLFLGGVIVFSPWVLQGVPMMGVKTAHAFGPCSQERRATLSLARQQVWERLTEALENFPIERRDREAGYVETEWVEGYSEKSFGALGGGISGGQWKRRMKLLIHVRPVDEETTEIIITSRVEEKAPGGSQAFRWRRVPSQGTIETSLIQELERGAGKKTDNT